MTYLVCQAIQPVDGRVRNPVLSLTFLDLCSAPNSENAWHVGSLQSLYSCLCTSLKFYVPQSCTHSRQRSPRSSNTHALCVRIKSFHENHSKLFRVYSRSSVSRISMLSFCYASDRPPKERADNISNPSSSLNSHSYLSVQNTSVLNI